MRGASVHEGGEEAGGTLGGTAAMPTLHSPCAKLVPWQGAELVRALEGWLKHGHVIEDEGAERLLNETAELSKMEALFTGWLKKQCVRLQGSAA